MEVRSCQIGAKKSFLHCKVCHWHQYFSPLGYRLHQASILPSSSGIPLIWIAIPELWFACRVLLPNCPLSAWSVYLCVHLTLPIEDWLPDLILHLLRLRSGSKTMRTLPPLIVSSRHPPFSLGAHRWSTWSYSAPPFPSSPEPLPHKTSCSRA